MIGWLAGDLEDGGDFLGGEVLSRLIRLVHGVFKKGGKEGEAELTGFVGKSGLVHGGEEGGAMDLVHGFDFGEVVFPNCLVVDQSNNLGEVLRFDWSIVFVGLCRVDFDEFVVFFCDGIFFPSWQMIF